MEVVTDFIFLGSKITRGFPGGSDGKSVCLQCERPGFNPWVRKIPWRREGYPFQYSGLENSMDCIDHGVAKGWTRLSDFHFTSRAEYIMQNARLDDTQMGIQDFW